MPLGSRVAWAEVSWRPSVLRISRNRVLKQLEAENLVRVRYRQIDILNEDGLVKVAGLDDGEVRT